MRRTPNRNWMLTLTVLMAIPAFTAATGERISFPADFRRWTLVKSAMVTAAHPAAAVEGGLHHVYANPRAVEGYASGRFPEGSAIAYELLETSEKDGVIAEGARRRLDVMVKDTTRFSSTGGWGFQRFMGSSESPAGEGATNSCYPCHQRAADHDAVFSRMR